MKVEASCCSVVDQFCDAPANLEPLRKIRTTCFCCGEIVCGKCSSLRKYLKYGRVRLCNNCQVDLDGDDEIVMNRFRKLAGTQNRVKRL